MLPLPIFAMSFQIIPSLYPDGNSTNEFLLGLTDRILFFFQIHVFQFKIKHLEELQQSQ